MAAQKRASQKKGSTPPPVESKETSRPAAGLWLDLGVGFINRFGRFSWDVLGVLLLALTLMTLLALTGLTQGAWLTPFVTLLRFWLGWGSGLVVIFSAMGGLFALRRRSLRSGSVHLGRILAIEGSAFTFLALLSILGGDSLTQAEAGQNGGVIGWGLAQLLLAVGLPPVVRNVLVAALFALLMAVSIGLVGLLTRWLEKQVELAEREEAAQISSLDMAEGEAPTGAEGTPAPAPQAARRPLLRVPPEFRKSFKVQPPEKEQPAAPPPRDGRLPPLNLLVGEQVVRPDERHINQSAGLIEKTLAEFGVPARVVGFRIGPTVTQFAVEPGFIEKPGPEGTSRQKVRVSQISALARDLALALSAERLRIEAPVPGRSYVGIEVPNARSTVVRLRPILEADAFYKVDSPLAIALGRDVSGQPVVADLARMPHLLIAGTTGSGKSVCIAALTACLIMNNPPADLRIAMIDPKMVELVRFNGTPHLLGKVETDLERILAVLRWALNEMDHRYRLLEQARARDIGSYNRKMEKRKQPTLPRIVVILDELADLMMSAPDQTEHSLVRLAQMARATGIHLIVATQRPSTDVVTGLIKANFPARISFTVASSIDSRVILDTTGAETLLGRGDMLFLNPEAGTPTRAQGVIVTDQEVERVITHWQKMSPPEENAVAPWEKLMNENENGNDELIEKAITIVRGEQRASASLLQRRLRIGYPRAARLIDELEELGVVGPSQGGGRDREVLIGPDDDEEGQEEEYDQEG